MEQRPLRLGDILDDYCPRERRVTNHAIVAMIGEDVKQTRCTTCDSEHAYKGGHQPRRKKKDAPSALYREVLATMPEADVAAAAVEDVAIPALIPPAVVTPPAGEPPVLDSVPVRREASGVSDPGENADVVDDDNGGDAPRPEEGPVHRRLIRATLPRPEGVAKEARPIPEFTIHRNAGRGGQFRGAQHRGNGSGQSNGNGHRSHGRRFAGSSNGQGSGFPGRGGQGRPSGFRGGQNPPRPSGGKKRSR